MLKSVDDCCFEQQHDGVKSTEIHNTNMLLVGRWRKSCTGWPLTSQNPFTPFLILIIWVARILGGANHEVVQDFRN